MSEEKEILDLDEEEVLEKPETLDEDKPEVLESTIEIKDIESIQIEEPKEEKQNEILVFESTSDEGVSDDGEIKKETPKEEEKQEEKEPKKKEKMQISKKDIPIIIIAVLALALCFTISKLLFGKEECICEKCETPVVVNPTQSPDINKDITEIDINSDEIQTLYMKYNRGNYSQLDETEILSVFYKEDLTMIDQLKITNPVGYFIYNSNMGTFENEKQEDGTYTLIAVKNSAEKSFGPQFRVEEDAFETTCGLQYVKETNTYKYEENCQKSAMKISYNKLYKAEKEENNIYMYVKVLYLDGNAITNSYSEGETLESMISEENKINMEYIWKYEDKAATYKYTFVNANGNNQLIKVEKVK